MNIFFMKYFLNISHKFMGKFFFEIFISSSSRVITSFRPRFAGKCDRQSRDLTQLTRGYISRLNRLLITPDYHVRTHTWESIAQKYSMENMNIFYPPPGIDLGHLSIQVERVFHWAMPPTKKNSQRNLNFVKKSFYVNLRKKR